MGLAPAQKTTFKNNRTANTNTIQAFVSGQTGCRACRGGRGSEARGLATLDCDCTIEYRNGVRSDGGSPMVDCDRHDLNTFRWLSREPFRCQPRL
jgi:hypothetical protein